MNQVIYILRFDTHGEGEDTVAYYQTLDKAREIAEKGVELFLSLTDQSAPCVHRDDAGMTWWIEPYADGANYGTEATWRIESVEVQ